MDKLPEGCVCCPRCGGQGYIDATGFTFADRVRGAREQNRMTQQELADAVGLSRTQITNIEGGRTVIPLDRLRKFSAVLHCPIEELVP